LQDVLFDISDQEDYTTGKQKRKNIMDDIARLTGRHFPGRKVRDEVDPTKRTSTKMCRVCYARGIRTNKGNVVETVWICGECPSRPGLHVDDCFKVYHTELDYAHKAQS
jgi:hypothetical protein